VILPRVVVGFLVFVSERGVPQTTSEAPSERRNMSRIWAIYQLFKEAQALAARLHSTLTAKL
jgi:hypothetical protein